VVDSVWAVVQLGVLAGLWTAGAWSVGTLAAAWGIGALAAVVVFVALGRERPVRPGAWWSETRYLSGWFTLTSVLGQVQVYLVLLLAGVALSAEDTAGLRAVQLLVYQPAVTLLAALVVLLVPAMSRLAASGDVVGLRRVRRVALLVAAAVGAVVLTAVPLRSVLLGALFPHYTGFAALVAPIAVQTAVTGLTVPFLAQLRGARRGGLLFGQQLVQLLALLAGAAAGVAVGGVRGLAWGMVAAAVVTLGSMAWTTRRLLSSSALRAPRAAAAPEAVA
jgi:hypothetical protein